MFLYDLLARKETTSKMSLNSISYDEISKISCSKQKQSKLLINARNIKDENVINMFLFCARMQINAFYTNRIHVQCPWSTYNNRNLVEKIKNKYIRTSINSWMGSEMEFNKNQFMQCIVFLGTIPQVQCRE